MGKSELERHFLEPLVERIFGDYPDLDYAVDLHHHALPPNVEVREFFMKTGDYLGNEVAQQNYISTNYTFVARDMMLQGINVIAQAVGAQGEGETLRLSLSSNPDVIFEVIEKMHEAGRPLLTIGVINHKMPFMPNGAEVAPAFYDVVVTDPAGTHTVFAPPNNRVSAADYAIGLHASSLVADGGTLQIGIGSLGDAIAQSLLVRDRHAAEYRKILETLCPDGLEGRELGRFDQGLYGCSEMFVNGFLQLIEAGIVRREVFADVVLQQLLNSGAIADETVTPQTLKALLAARRIGSPLSADDLAFLQRFGILRPDVTLDASGHLACGGKRYANDLNDPAHFAAIAQHLLGARLEGGIFMTGGFFLGPNDFYERLRTMPREQLRKIDMTRIDFINQLDGQSELKRAQRRKARFMNTTMIVTLLGAAVSDALENGQVISGVGGQYNFVAMAHELPGARSILMLRSTRESGLTTSSNIVWNYGHTTIPRHLRDIVITEYGIADLRGRSDQEVVTSLLNIADSRFQPELLEKAKRAGKIPQDYQIPPHWLHNTPGRIQARLTRYREMGLLPDFPLGTDFTEEEIVLGRVLKGLKPRLATKGDLMKTIVRAMTVGSTPATAKRYLARLRLDQPTSQKDKMIQKLIVSELLAGGYV